MSNDETREDRTFTPDEPVKKAAEKIRATPAELWTAFDGLTLPKSVRLTRTDAEWLREVAEQTTGSCSLADYRAATTERVTLPSLFDQLVAAVQSGAGGQAHGVQESKPPLDAAALALLIDIAEHTRTGCWNWRIKRAHDTPLDLKRVVKAVIAHGDPATIDMTCQKIRSWCGQIKATISSEPDRTWRMHGATCRVCSSSSVPVWLDDGTETRQPALIVHSQDGTIERVECAFCGSMLTGEDLTAMVRATLNAETTQKTA